MLTIENVNIKLTSSTAKMPTRGSEQAAGWDLYADILEGDSEHKDDIVAIAPHETVKVSAGIAMSIPEGYFGGVFARSGLATKQGLRPSNCTGVCDSDYRGSVIVALHNDSNKIQYVQHGDRIAQYILIPYASMNLNLVDELDETARGAGGFGSTGNK